MKKLTTTAWVVALLVLPLDPALAQQSASGSSSGAPVFSIQNFQGDARSGDLYDYMHQQPHPQWDQYRRRLQDAAGKVVNTQPLRQTPSPENVAGTSSQSITNTNAVVQSASSALPVVSATNSTGQAQPLGPMPTQPNVTTNVQGTVLTPNVSVPGLVDQ